MGGDHGDMGTDTDGSTEQEYRELVEAVHLNENYSTGDLNRLRELRDELGDRATRIRDEMDVSESEERV